jgi:1-deoxy-D-xylulose-5-phosphate synthase
LLDNNVVVPVMRLGVPDTLVDHATPEQSFASLGLNPSQMCDRILATFSRKQSPVSV